MEADRILSHINYYSTLTHNPTAKYQKEYTHLINTAFSDNVISDKEKKYLIVKYPKTVVYYHLPKIHKNAQNPPGRPIISEINSISRPLSKYIDIFLQNYVTTLQSYLKDSAALILLLDNMVWSLS